MQLILQPSIDRNYFISLTKNPIILSPQNAFTIYNAAAGAGKTYTLVKAYLTTLLQSTYNEGYKNILAITFTNKAVAEMKNRILQNLVNISNPNPTQGYYELLISIAKEINIPEEELQKKTFWILRSILHNYASFDIVTIDTFTHRVLRTFAKDLGIPMNFEIEMDTEALIEEAVDALMSKVGTDPQLTKTIIDFAISKLDEDKSWDVTLELTKIAQLIFSENDRHFLDKIKDKTFDDFDALQKMIFQKKNQTKNQLKKMAQEVLEKIETNHIQPADFTRGSIPAHFQKIVDEQAVDLKAAWKQDITTASFYNKKLDQGTKDQIDAIRPYIETAFLETKTLLQDVKLYENCLKNIVPLSVLTAIHREIQSIKEERSLVLISEFNTIIGQTVKDQPAPFIYERLGERYRDYFIDEFQDTSSLQWDNLIPLVENALSTETLTGKRGHLTIVGDAKQAIYRWRGGKAELLVGLSNDENPFSIPDKKVLNLPKNYRSCKEVIQFNNDFFSFISQDLSNPQHTELYLSGNKQQINDKEEGYVNISFVEAKNVAEENELYPERVLQIISELQQKGYQLKDICILTRKQKEGSVLADYLTEKGIPIVSSETLLIQNDPKVRFIIDLLTWIQNPNDILAKTQTLYFLASYFGIKEVHSFLKQMLPLNKSSYSQRLSDYMIFFSFQELETKPFYQAVEYIINAFDLGNTAPGYLQFFLDVVFSYTQKNTDGLQGFLTYWKLKKDKLSIIAPEGENAIQMMTIHKSKGLEFPCVIYPYANNDIYNQIDPKAWLPVKKDDFLGFDTLFINYYEQLSELSQEGSDIVLDRKSQLELDNYNILYVALTRAREQLYIISKKEISAKGVCNSNKFSGKLIHFLQHKEQWNPDVLQYEFGSPNMVAKPNDNTTETIKDVTIRSFRNQNQSYKVQIVTNSKKIWDQTQEEAVERGNLIHELMAAIDTANDVEPVLQTAYQKGEINDQEVEILKTNIHQLINHPELYSYFDGTFEIYKEKEILSDGKLYRPDRIMINSRKEAILIDYKTGNYHDSHQKQLIQYGHLLKLMNYSVKNMLLVYFNKKISVKSVSEGLF